MSSIKEFFDGLWERGLFVRASFPSASSSEEFSIAQIPFWAIAFKAAIVLAVAGLAVWLIQKSNPRWRMLILRLAAGGALAMPILTAAVPAIRVPIIPSAMQAALPEKDAVAAAPKMAMDSIPSQTMPGIPLSRESNPAANPSSVATSRSALASTPPLQRIVDYPQILLGIWIAGVAAALFSTAIRKWQIRRLVIKSTVAPDYARCELDSICDLMGVENHVGLRCLPEALTPFLYGIRNPVIVIPPRMLDREFQDDLPAVLAHELAHIRSRDLAWKVCFRAAQILYWFNPFVWLVRRAHDSVCEELSDAKAALYVGDVEVYSQTLARVTLDLLLNPPVCVGLSMAQLPEIRRRLEILKRKVHLSPISRTLSFALVLLGAAAMIGLAGFQAVNAQNLPALIQKDSGAAPFRLGEKWVYQHSGNRTLGDILQLVKGDRVEEITGVCVENGKPQWLMTEIWGDTDYDPWRFFIDRNRLLQKVESGAEIVHFDPGVPYDWMGLKPGELKTVKSDIAADGFTGVCATTVQRVADETIVVPAGEYTNCIKVQMTVSESISQRDGPPLVFQFVYWYHPKANGFVKESFEYKPSEGNPISGVSMLKSHVVPEPKASAAMNLDVKIEHLPSLRVACFHATGEAPELAAWEKLQTWAKPLGLLQDIQKHPVFGFNNPNPTPGQKEYGYEFWIAVGPEIQTAEGGELKEFPGGRYAAVKNVKLADVEAVYLALWKWIQENSYKWRNSNELEKLHNPMASPEEIILDIYVPIEE